MTRWQEIRELSWRWKLAGIGTALLFTAEIAAVAVGS